MIMGKILLTSQGDAPYQGPVLHSATARAAGGLVIVTVSAIVPDRGIVPVPIELAMSVTTASLLMRQLREAIEDSRRA